ncbi:MAG: helix-turn-helix domain-containing protein [Alphaproteobacteria bacterium]
MNLAMTNYTEFPLPNPYDKWVEGIWFFDNSAPQNDAKRVLPDCCVDLIFDLTGKQEPRWVGTMTRPLMVPQTRTSKLLGVRFRPGFAVLAMGGAVAAAADTVIEVSSLGQKSIAVLGEKLMEAPDRSVQLAMLANWLGKIFMVPSAAFPCALQFLGTLDDGGWKYPISGWAETLGVSTRQLERTIKGLVGVAPAEFRSLLRFRNALNILKQTGQASAETALVSGYFDQPHFIRDFKRFSGLTPGQYLVSH